MTAPNVLIRVTVFGLLIALLITTMILGKQLLIPVTWAFLFSVVLTPACAFLEKKKLSRSLAAVLVTLVFCLIAGCILFFLIYEAAIILKNEGSIYEKAKEAFDNLNRSLQNKYGIALSPGGKKFDFGGAMKMVAGQVSALSANLITLTLIPMYLFFILSNRYVLDKFIERKFHGEELKASKKFFTQSQESIQNYLVGTLLLTGVCAILSFIILLLFGIEYAFFFAVFIAILNLIPYIGNLFAFAVVLLYVEITKDSGSTTLLVGITLYASNLVQENFLRPKLVGDKMEMSAMMVFTAVVVGGMIWGFSGMVLFIPLLGILQALLNSSDELRPYGVFFENRNQEPGKTSK